MSVYSWQWAMSTIGKCFLFKETIDYTANVLTVEYADVCLHSESKDNHELYLQSFVCGAVVLASVCL